MEKYRGKDIIFLMFWTANYFFPSHSSGLDPIPIPDTCYMHFQGIHTRTHIPQDDKTLEMLYLHFSIWLHTVDNTMIEERFK